MSLFERLKKAFGKEADASRYIAGGLDVDGESVRDYGEQYMQAYSKVSTVHACMSAIANDMAAAPIVIEARGANKNGRPSWERVAPGEGRWGQVADVFARANPEQGPSLMWAQFHLQRLAAGNAYLLTDYLAGKLKLEDVRPKGQGPRELWAIRPDQIKPIIRRGRRIAYEHRVGGEEIIYRPDEIVHYAEASPLSALLGEPHLAAAELDARIESRLENFTHQVLGRGNVRPFALELPVVNGVPISVQDAQIEQWEASWRSKFRGGFLDKVPFLKYGFKPTPLDLMFDPAALLRLAEFHREQIALVFGVPLARLGQDVTDHNVEEQMPLYYEGTLMTAGRLLEELMTEVAMPRWGARFGELRFRLDWDATPAVQRMLDKRAGSYVELSGGPVYTPDEARERIHLPPVLGGNTLREQSTTVPSGPIIRPREAPAKALTPGKWLDTPERAVKRLAAEASLTRFDAPAEKMVRDYFTAQESRVLARAGHANKSLGKSVDLEDLWDEDIEIEAARALLIRLHTAILRQRGPEAMAEVGSSQAFLLDDPEVQDFLERNSYEFGKLITGTTRDRLVEAIFAASQAGETAVDLATRIRDAFGVRRDQAMTIARTEGTRAYSFATFSGWVQSEVVTGKRWLTAGDDAVRDLHRGLDNEAVALFATFSNGLPFPGAPGPAEQTINCRCVLEPVLEGEELKGASFTIAPAFARAFFSKDVDTPKNGAVAVRP